jgi:hypothetical protein
MFNENQTIVARVSGARWRVHYAEPAHYVVQCEGNTKVYRFTREFVHKHYRPAAPHELMPPR